MSHTRNTTIGLTLTFLGVVVFSLTLPMTRLAVEAMTPMQVAIWRGIVAAIFASLFLVVLRPPAPHGRHWLYLIVCAAGTVFGFPLFTTLGMQTVNASHGAVVVGLLPLATAVCGTLISNERPSALFWVSAVIGSALTVAFVLRQAGNGGLEVGHIWLFLAVIAAAFGYAYGGLASRTLPGWSVACWALVVSLPVLLPFGLAFPPPSIETPITSLVAFLYLSVFSQLLGFFAFYKGFALAGIARGSQVQLLQLFLTIAFASTVFGEPLDVAAILFGALVVAAVATGLRAKISSSAVGSIAKPTVRHKV